MLEAAPITTFQAAHTATAFAAPWYHWLEQEGFLVHGSVSLLKTAEEGVRFVRDTEKALPRGWDLLDAFSTLDFGPWKPDGYKDINASLRSMGMFSDRWRNSKLDALWHPLPSRETVVMEHERLLREGALDAAGLLDLFPNAFRLASRMEVEIFALETYLGHEDWLERLWPDRPGKEREALAKDLIRRSAPARDAGRRLLQTLGESAGNAKDAMIFSKG
jgi:hypothetical protein